MARRFSVATIAVALLVPTAETLACSCPFDTPNYATIAEAEKIVFFRIDGARTYEGTDTPFFPIVRGETSLVEVVQGESFSLNYIFYTTLPTCCGTRVDVGRDYVVFLKDQDVLAGGGLIVSSDNLIELGGMYERETIEEAIRLVRSKEASFRDVFPQSLTDRTRMYALPPPCFPDIDHVNSADRQPRVSASRKESRGKERSK